MLGLKWSLIDLSSRMLLSLAQLRKVFEVLNFTLCFEENKINIYLIGLFYSE